MATQPDKKEKARWARIKRVYGITQEQYEQLDSGACYVCERAWSDTVQPCIDHNHKTGEVRGLLCRFCNRYRVGRFTDANIVRRIYEYLNLPSTNWIVPPKKKKRRSRKGTESSERKKRATRSKN